jgi:Family of unknown function (DUF6412)
LRNGESGILGVYGTMATTALGGLLVMLAGLLRDLAQLAVGPTGLIGPTATALAATVLAGTMLAAVLALLSSVAGVSRTAAALPLIRRARALREKSWRAAFLRQRDPDAAGRTRPRAPSAAPAAATSR